MILEKSSLIFRLRLEPTYYKQGFFNVIVDYDRFVRPDEGPIIIDLGSDGLIRGRVSRSYNLNRTARIMGGKGLRDWFQKHFKVNDVVEVDLTSREVIRLNRPVGR